jgi:hypothetical protein
LKNGKYLIPNADEAYSVIKSLGVLREGVGTEWVSFTVGKEIKVKQPRFNSEYDPSKS